MVHYRRARTPGACYFLTLALQDRASGLLVRHHRELGEALRLACRQKPCRLPAIVLLPDHLHMLMTLPEGEANIWQRRFWEHLVHDEQDFAAHVDYIHINPLQHGLVERVRDWPHSSFHRHVRRGILPIDWAGGGEQAVSRAGE